jgi:hypothetical protein
VKAGGDRVAFSRAYEYNCLGQLIKISEQTSAAATGGRTALTQLNYTRGGRLASLTDERATWTYRYDDNGNAASVDYGLGRVAMAYEHGDRVASFAVGGGSDGLPVGVSYDNDTGNLIRRGDYEFVYNDLGKLVQIWRGDVLRKELDYDSRGRVVRMRDKDDVIVSLVYMMADRPWLVTHVAEGDGGPVQLLTYGRADQLISVDMGERLFTVITSSSGSPLALLEDGRNS